MCQVSKTAEKQNRRLSLSLKKLDDKTIISAPVHCIFSLAYGLDNTPPTSKGPPAWKRDINIYIDTQTCRLMIIFIVKCHLCHHWTGLIEFANHVHPADHVHSAYLVHQSADYVYQ